MGKAPRAAFSALWLVPSPMSSLDGTWASCASEISVGERTGPGLLGGPCLALPLRDLVWIAPW